MKGGWVQAEDLYGIIIFFENIVKRTLENLSNLAEYPLENPGKEFHFTVGHLAYVERNDKNARENQVEMSIISRKISGKSREFCLQISVAVLYTA